MPAVGRQSGRMLELILLAVASIAAQEGAVAYRASELYAPPVVRPFEPPSNFGRVVEEGDGRGDPRRRPLIAPVAVESYSRSYEYAPSTADAAYDQGVDNAERAMDSRMGPLDGVWKVRDAGGRLVMRIALMDRGEARPLEGAFQKADAAAELAPFTTIERAGDRVAFGFENGRIEMTATPEGWTGRLVEGDRERTVSLTR